MFYRNTDVQQRFVRGIQQPSWMLRVHRAMSNSRLLTQAITQLTPLFLVLALLYPRFNGAEGLSQYLWGEDGSVFINQANELGIASLWQPYAGYLHVYPRLVAYVASFFPLTQQVIFFVMGWGLGFFWMVQMLCCRLQQLHIRPWIGLLILMGMVWQPHGGEVFFCLAYVQWILALALMVYVLTWVDPAVRPSSASYVAIFLASVTGPFSFLMLPLMFIKMKWLDQCSRTYWGLYGVVLIGAVLQLGVFLHSDRVGMMVMSVHWGDWWRALKGALFFGQQHGSVWLAWVFWAGVVCIFSSLPRGRRTTLVWLLMGTAVFMWGIALYACRAFPQVVQCWRASRYMWLPYAFVFLSVGIAFNDDWGGSPRRMAGWALALWGLACTGLIWKNFTMVPIAHLPFEAYAHFSTVHDVMIPVAPLGAEYPGWHIHGRPQHARAADQVGDASMLIKSAEATWQLKTPIVCDGAKNVGVELALSRQRAGRVRLIWSETASFQAPQSLARYYPEGPIIAQFAFPYQAPGMYVKAQSLPRMGGGGVVVKEIRVWCLK